jgi:ribose 5-phosphate isomerase B
MKANTIVLGCDNAAVEMKNIIADFLKSKGINVENVGVDDSSDQTYYPCVAQKVCEEIIESGYTKDGILLCGTGIGMAMAANKFKGIRATVCHDNFSAERSRLSNDGNVLCMGARVIGPELAKKIVAEWISLTFIDGSSTPKVAAIKEIEAHNMK